MFNCLKKLFHVEPEKNCSTCAHSREDFFKNHYHCKRVYQKGENTCGRHLIILADFTDTDYFPCEFHSPKQPLHAASNHVPNDGKKVVGGNGEVLQSKCKFDSCSFAEDWCEGSSGSIPL